MNFGQAIAAMRNGSRVQRAGWNGKNMFVFLTPASEERGIVTLPYLSLFTAEGTIQIGWLASQADILGDDWSVMGHDFYLMRGPDGPTVERRPIELPVSAPEVPTHLSSERTLRLPERISKAIGLPDGGGVSFVDKGDGVVEMMSDLTFLTRAGLGDDTE